MDNGLTGIILDALVFKAVGGLGIFLLGMKFMSDGMQAVAGTRLRSLMGAVTNNRIAACAIGTLVTNIVQPSSVTTVMVVGFVNCRFMTLMQALGVVIGANVGTTITAFLASLGATVNAKRAAYAHIIFNVVGTLWLIPIFFWYTSLMETILKDFGGFFGLNPGIVSKIALTHTCFNIVNTLVFLPILRPFANLVTRLVPDKSHKETPHLTFLDVRLLESPAMGIAQSQDEIIRMGEYTAKMSTMLRTSLESDDIDDNNTRRVLHREEILDIMQDEVTEFLSHILSGNIPLETVEAGREQLRMADEYESVSDYYAKILKLNLKRIKNEIKFSEGGRKDLLALHDLVDECLQHVSEGVTERRPEVLSKANIQGEAITVLVKESRRRHLAKVGKELTNPRAALIFTDMLNSYRRVKDHVLNIAEAWLGRNRVVGLGVTQAISAH